MSVQVTGTEYLMSYSGCLKIIEEVFNIATLISAAFCGYTLKTFIIHFIATYGFFCTIIVLVVHVRLWHLKSDQKWYWIESLNCLTIGLIYLIATGIILSEMTKPFIITGVFGFSTAMAYGLDTRESFKLLLTPRNNYVWTIPNMPL